MNHLNSCKYIVLPFFILALSLIPSFVFGNPLALGSKLMVASGEDPDIALDKSGALHLAYVKGNSTYYRKVFPPYQFGKMGPEYFVGNGINPQIEVDSLGAPHIVFGYAHYSRWNGSGFTTAVQAFSGWRKNLIAIDSKNRVYIVADRFSPRDVLVRVYLNGAAITNAVSVGNDNPGGVAMDGEDTLHVTWRDNYTYYNTYTIGSGKGSSHMFSNGSGDFSWCSVDVLRNTIHAVHTAAHGKGIYYIPKRNNKWNQAVHFAEQEVKYIEPDYVNPVSATDVVGNTYITFSGTASRGYFALMDNTDQLYSGVQRLDPEADSNAGAKMTNPNIVSNSSIYGAFAAWGTENVFVRSIGYSPVIVENDKISLSPIYNLLLVKKEQKPVIVPILHLLLNLLLKPDITVPIAGNSGIISTDNVTANSVTLNWTLAEDNVTAQADLEYLAYYSTSNNITSVADMETNVNVSPVGTYAANITAVDVSSLLEGTTYYFNIIVKDEAGNKTAYSTVTQATTNGTEGGLSLFE